ncbi:hypothetical protein LRR80_05219 [Streptomyces sp. RO-S4]|nr:hypothetical protein [Streptomyces sp. RO-S4]
MTREDELDTTCFLTSLDRRHRGGPARTRENTVWTVLWGGDVQTVFYRPPTRRLTLTPLSPERADGLRVGMHLYRLGTLTPPGPHPPGLGRPADDPGHEHLMRWCRELAADFGESVTIDAAFGAPHPLRRKALHLMGDPGRHPVSMAGLNPLVAGMVRLGPDHTPHHLRGHGYRGRRHRRGQPGRARRGRHGGGAVYERREPHQQRPPPTPRTRPGHRLGPVRLHIRRSVKPVRGNSASSPPRHPPTARTRCAPRP